MPQNKSQTDDTAFRSPKRMRKRKRPCPLPYFSRSRPRIWSEATLYPGSLQPYLDGHTSPNEQPTMYQHDTQEQAPRLGKRCRHHQRALNHATGFDVVRGRAMLQQFLDAQLLRRSPRLSAKASPQQSSLPSPTITIECLHRASTGPETYNKYRQLANRHINQQLAEDFPPTTQETQQKLQCFIRSFKEKGKGTKDALVYEQDDRTRCTRAMAIILPKPKRLLTQPLRQRRSTQDIDTNYYDHGHLIGLALFPYPNNTQTVPQHFIGNQAVAKTAENRARQYADAHYASHHVVLKTEVYYAPHKPIDMLNRRPIAFAMSLYAVNKETLESVTVFTVSFNNPQPTYDDTLQSTYGDTPSSSNSALFQQERNQPSRCLNVTGNPQITEMAKSVSSLPHNLR